MQVVNDNQMLFDYKTEEKNNKYEVSWKFKGDVRGFILCAAPLNLKFPTLNVLQNNADMDVIVKRGQSQEFRLPDLDEYLFYYIDHGDFKKMGDKVVLPDKVKVPGKVLVSAITTDLQIHVPAETYAVILPMQIIVSIKTRYEKVGIIKKEKFYDIIFNCNDRSAVPEGAVFYKVGSIEYPMNIAKLPKITLKDNGMSPEAGAFQEYKELLTIKVVQ